MRAVSLTRRLPLSLLVTLAACAAAPGRSLLPGRALGVARQPVVRDRLPRRGIGRELAVLRADPGVVVECPEAHADDLRVVRAPAPERRAAGRAERLREAMVGRGPHADELLTFGDAQRAGLDPGLHGRGRPAAALAARAVAVAGGDGRRGHLEADAAAEAAAGQRKLGHPARI